MKELKKNKSILFTSAWFIALILICLTSCEYQKHKYSLSPSDTLESIASNDYLINPSELSKISYQLIDIRSQFEYEKGHLENAINMFVPEILNHTNTKILKRLKKENIEIVLYGANPEEALIPYMTLYQQGVDNMKILLVNNSYKQNKLISENSTLEESKMPPSEFELLANYLEAHGNFINSELAPALISASDLKENLHNNKNLVIDIRTPTWYARGHVEGAKNVQPVELLNYFENKIDPSNFDKITMVCYSGQSASYYTSLLRLYGFDNVYSLKWGMGSWADELASLTWEKNAKDELNQTLEETANTKPANGVYPFLTTNKKEASEILKTRIKEAFAKSYREFIVSSPAIFENLEDYFIVNYVDEDVYNAGHLKGAIHYQPNKDLALGTNLSTLPNHKKILVNSDTGFPSAYVVAYLHILGYEVYNLAYGNNSYMNSKLVEKGWNGWTKEEIKNFRIEK